MEEMHEMVTVARLIWLKRNKFVFEGEFTPPAILVQNAHDQVKAFNKAEVRLGGHSGVRHSSVVEVWQKPPIGSIKVN
jgi:hypothetical protein